MWEVNNFFFISIIEWQVKMFSCMIFVSRWDLKVKAFVQTVVSALHCWSKALTIHEMCSKSQWNQSGIAGLPDGLLNILDDKYPREQRRFDCWHVLVEETCLIFVFLSHVTPKRLLQFPKKKNPNGRKIARHWTFVLDGIIFCYHPLARLCKVVFYFVIYLLFFFRIAHSSNWHPTANSL